MNTKEFETRKADHLRLSLDEKVQSPANDWASIELIHEALPELDFSSINLATKFWKHSASSPFFISSMTAGHKDGESLNLVLAKAAQIKNWPMGVGSQRRELGEPQAKLEWKRLRKLAPQTLFFSNLGLSQLVHTPFEQVLGLAETLESIGFIVHTNPLQEALQPEGTPQFTGGIKALEKLCKKSPIPVILKETGCGFSSKTLTKLKSVGLSAIDVAGRGGTHWGRIEGYRANAQSEQAVAAQVYANWGQTTVQSLLAAQKIKNSKLEIWASGGVRSGLDAAKCIALGAKKVGFAKPALENAVLGEEALLRWMSQMEFELKVALFCTSSKNPAALGSTLGKDKKWQKI